MEKRPNLRAYENLFMLKSRMENTIYVVSGFRHSKQREKNHTNNNNWINKKNVKIEEIFFLLYVSDDSMDKIHEATLNENNAINGLQCFLCLLTLLHRFID